MDLIYLTIALSAALMIMFRDSLKQFVKSIRVRFHRVRPVSVNYFIHRKCNYSCKFCFHTAKTSYFLPLQEAKRGLRLLKAEGMKKINFSGGEPFFKSQLLGDLVEFCKVDLKLESVTIVSNGSLIKEEWFEKYGQYLDIIAISCDSFNSETLYKIGRFQEGKDHLEQLNRIKLWCNKYKVLFKINTVVNSQNHLEDMNVFIQALKPSRWKVFQCLLINGENAGPDALRDATEMLVTTEQFNAFVERHKDNHPIAENNDDMKDSYLNLDEYMRFLNCQNGGKEPTKSILDVGVQAALDKAGFDEKAFLRRGGKFKWSKPQTLDW